MNERRDLRELLDFHCSRDIAGRSAETQHQRAKQCTAKFCAAHALPQDAPKKAAPSAMHALRIEQRDWNTRVIRLLSFTQYE